MLKSFPEGGLAVVIGASGGIGAAVDAQVRASNAFAQVISTRRSGSPKLDLTDESDSAALAGIINATGLDLRLVFDATGYLHGPHGGPEKSWSAIDPARCRASCEDFDEVGAQKIAKPEGATC